jgi:mRNA interferase HigB
MHVIAQKALKDAAGKFPEHKVELAALGLTVAKGYFKTPEALRAQVPSLDNFKYLDKHYVVDIGHNDLRLIAMIFFDSQKFYIRHIFTHREYDMFIANWRIKGKH